MAHIELTEAAAEKAKDLRARSGSPDDALRLRVRDGGCSGMRYELVFDGKSAEDDERSEHFGLPVLVDAGSAAFLEGTRIDFVDDLNESGFKIQNPLAEQTCGCGESFKV